MTKLIISGICGRMGKRIALLAKSSNDFEIIAGLEFKGSSSIGKDIGEVLGIDSINKKVGDNLSKVDSSGVLIEFTTREATIQHLEEASKKKIPMVIGTTNLSSEDIDKIKASSKKIPIVFSPNMSVGVNLLFRVTEEITKALGRDYKITMKETHHTKKKDSPSGTAKKLQDIVSSVRGKKPSVESIREGDVVGDHSVIFDGKTEKIVLMHHAKSRDVFAKGALDAAKFIVDMKSGFFTMQEVINGI